MALSTQLCNIHSYNNCNSNNHKPLYNDAIRLEIKLTTRAYFGLSDLQGFTTVFVSDNNKKSSQSRDSKVIWNHPNLLYLDVLNRNKAKYYTLLYSACITLYFTTIVAFGGPE